MVQRLILLCVFEYVSYDTACKYILLQKAITKSIIFVGNSFFIKGNSAVVMDKGGKFLKNCGAALVGEYSR